MIAALCLISKSICTLKIECFISNSLKFSIPFFDKQHIPHLFRKTELNIMMLLLQTIFTIGLLRIGSGYSNKALETYQGHILLEAVPRTEQQLITLQQLIHCNNSEIDVWALSSSIRKKSLILVAPQRHYDIYKRMLDDGIKVKIVIDNLKSMFATHANIIERRVHKRNFSSKDFDLSEYHTYDEITEYMKMISYQYPNWTKLISVGYSFEGRELLAIKIGTASSSFWIDAGIHSREWISVSSAVFIIGQLVKQYNLDRNLRRLLSETSWIILPVFNPDGYEFTWNGDRLWRKSRSKYEIPLFNPCVGVDLNRNFDMDFGGFGSSSNPCSNVYHGRHSFSEPETRAVMRYLSKMQDKIKACISLHSFSQLWLMPYGNEQRHYPTNYKEMVKLANGAVKQLRRVHRSIYKVIKASDLYISTGDAIDWVLNATSIKYAFTVELRPATLEKGGFILPEKEIVPTGEEIFIGLKFIAENLIKRTNFLTFVNLDSIKRFVFEVLSSMQNAERVKFENKTYYTDREGRGPGRSAWEQSTQIVKIIAAGLRSATHGQIVLTIWSYSTFT
ncbi:Carboxypeptidase A2 [Trichinella zimbabwensis]|uniref:Carboxypeptidase A2 n=1 Tax=Trichinella zimbabwensis TaxID=268475 RepID=A0A0V1HJ46_9BILA|nr:Carboxypeptidase A2 [Trichinella zimbabwensis]